MKSITLEDLEEMLDEVFPGGFQIETDDEGQIIIYTNLTEDDEGNLVPFDEDADDDFADSDEDEDFEPYDESSSDDD